MATTKTLTPTNQTITIAAFQGEKPDHRHVADAESKLADAINALNSQLATLATNRTATISVGEVTGTYKDVQISVSNSDFQLVKGSRIEGSSGLALMGVWFNDDKIQARVRNVSGGTIATGATVVVIYC